MNIFSRKICQKVEKYLFTEDVLVLHGARQVGKTYILYYLRDLLISKGEVVQYLDLEDGRNLNILNLGVGEFINNLKEEGIYPANGKRIFVLIDEIQYLDDPSNFLKLIYDHHKEIKLVVSGSSSFSIKSKFKDSLVGRTVDFEIYPLLFEEFLLFKGVTYKPLEKKTRVKEEELRRLYVEFALYGGYPKVVLAPDLESKETYIQQIIDTYVRKDIKDLANISDIAKFNSLLEVLAGSSGKLLNIVELSSTLAIARNTLTSYISILQETYIIRLVNPYSKNIRSEVSKMPKIFFYDTGLLHMLYLKQLPKTVLGESFETSIFSELVKKYGVSRIYYWRSLDKKEIDFVLESVGGEAPIPIEVKINFAQFKRLAVDFFLERYGGKNYYVVGLNGKKTLPQFKYPWGI